MLQRPSSAGTGIVINIGNRNGLGNLPYANVGTPLAPSPKLRQAFEEAIDRNTLNRVVFGGLYQPSCTPIPPANTAGTTRPGPVHAVRPAGRAQARRRSPASRTRPCTCSPPTATDSSTRAVHPGRGGGGRDQRRDRPGPTARPALAARSAATSTPSRDLVTGSRRPTGNIFQFLATTGRAQLGGYSNPRLDLSSPTRSRRRPRRR